MRTYPYSKEFANLYGLREAVVMEYLRRKNKTENPFVISYQGIAIAMPELFTKNTARHAVDHLRWLGFLNATRSKRADRAFTYTVTPRGRMYLGVMTNAE